MSAAISGAGVRVDPDVAALIRAMVPRGVAHFADYLFRNDGAQKIMSTRVASIASKEDLADFIEALRDDFLKDPSEWENHTVDRYLDAMAAWVRDMDSYYKNAREIPPAQPTWQTMADILSAARIYE